MASAEELGRLLALADDLGADEWARPTDCTGWTVRDVLGVFAPQADPEERTRQIKTAAALAGRSGDLRINEMTALQVREHADLTVEQLRCALHEAGTRGLAARRAMPAAARSARGRLRAAPTRAGGPSDTRAPWPYRVDICRATERELQLTAEHDGRIVADRSRWSSPGLLATCSSRGRGAPPARRDRVLPHPVRPRSRDRTAGHAGHL